MNLRVSADQAGWSIREAAWGFEERVLWRGSDAAQAAVDRAGRATAPLQRLIQTRLTWPLSERLPGAERKDAGHHRGGSRDRSPSRPVRLER